MINAKRLGLGFLIAAGLLLHVLHASDAGRTILLVGDSHIVGAFGETLDQRLRSLPDTTVETYAGCGATARTFLVGGKILCGYLFRGVDGQDQEVPAPPRAPVFSETLARVMPSTVVVELGSNYCQDWEDAAIENDMRTMAEAIRANGAECVWVTMPDTRKYAEAQKNVLEITRRAVGPYCTIVESTRYTKYPAEGGDGLHYSGGERTAIAKAWAEAAFGEIADFLQRP